MSISASIENVTFLQKFGDICEVLRFYNKGQIMKKKNHILNGIILVYCILAAAFSFWYFTGSSIKLDQPKEIHDNDQLFRRLEQSIPVRIRISNEYWGSREITAKQQVLSLWERINHIPKAVASQEADPMPFRSTDTINGSVVFLNGDTDFFEISNYISCLLYTSRCV